MFIVIHLWFFGFFSHSLPSLFLLFASWSWVLWSQHLPLPHYAWSRLASGSIPLFVRLLPFIKTLTYSDWRLTFGEKSMQPGLPVSPAKERCRSRYQRRSVPAPSPPRESPTKCISLLMICAPLLPSFIYAHYDVDAPPRPPAHRVTPLYFSAIPHRTNPHPLLPVPRLDFERYQPGGDETHLGGHAATRIKVTHPTPVGNTLIVVYYHYIASKNILITHFACHAVSEAASGCTSVNQILCVCPSIDQWFHSKTKTSLLSAFIWVVLHSSEPKRRITSMKFTTALW